MFEYKQCLRSTSLAIKTTTLWPFPHFLFTMRYRKLCTLLILTFICVTKSSTSANSCRLCNRMTPDQCASQPLSTCPNQDNGDGACLLEYEHRLERYGVATLFFSSRCVTQNVCQSAVRSGSFYFYREFFVLSKKFHDKNFIGIFKYIP